MATPKVLRDRFDKVFDVDIVLKYELTEFFEFCQYLGYFGYHANGFAGKLQSPAEFVRHHRGNCWDQTELQRKWFKEHGYDTRTYLLYYRLLEDCWPSHSILVYRRDGKWYWFEPLFYGTGVEYSGIHEYGSEKELLKDFYRVFKLNSQKIGLLPEELEKSKWSLYEYEKPMYGVDDREFYSHCRRGREIAVEEL